MDVNEELKNLGKLKKKIGGGSGGGAVGLGGQVGCERSIEVFGKIQKKKNFFFWGVGGGGGGGRGRVGRGQGGCEQRIEVFVKIQKKKKFFFFLGGGVGLEVQSGCERKISFCENSIFFFFFFGGGGRGEGVGRLVVRGVGLGGSGWM